ncbi:hypothetical protein D3C71_2100890 [compost metagenome]
MIDEIARRIHDKDIPALPELDLFTEVINQLVIQIDKQHTADRVICSRQLSADRYNPSILITKNTLHMR